MTLDVMRFKVNDFNDEFDAEEVRQYFNLTADQKAKIEEWLYRRDVVGDTLLLVNHNQDQDRPGLPGWHLLAQGVPHRVEDRGA